MNHKNIPNLLSLIRILLIIPLMYFILIAEYKLALMVFGISAFTDLLDGWLARWLKCESAMGAILDPLADKLLLISVFFTLCYLGLIPILLALVVISRDLLILIGALLIWLINNQVVIFKPSIISKINTVLQVLLIACVIIEISDVYEFPDIIITTLVYTVFATAIISGIGYLKSAIKYQ
tara:strand:- start:32047 stop:32586 length:540 start_codon:yes stop_codon:yes gene_type:complete